MFDLHSDLGKCLKLPSWLSRKRQKRPQNVSLANERLHIFNRQHQCTVFCVTGMHALQGETSVLETNKLPLQGWLQGGCICPIQVPMLL